MEATFLTYKFCRTSSRSETPELERRSRRNLNSEIQTLYVAINHRTAEKTRIEEAKIQQREEILKEIKKRNELLEKLVNTISSKNT